MHAKGDQELVAAVKAGDAEAYGELFERYQSRIYNFTYGILGNAEDARDVTQDAFIRVFEALPRKEHVEFSAYLYRAARNAAYDVAKARGRYTAPDDLEAVRESSMYADPERATLFCEQQETVRGAMAALPDDYRAILTLREVQELSYQQIADALEMTRTNVGVTIMRARLKFKGAFRMSHVDVDALCAECQAMLPKLSAYIDDELKPDERAKVEAHLDDCPLCRYALDEMRESSKSYRAFVPLIPPEAMRAEVLWRVSQIVGGPGEGAQTTGGGPAASQGSAPGSTGGAGTAGGSEDLTGGRGGGGDTPVITKRAPAPVSRPLIATLGFLAGAAIAFIVLGLLSAPRELPQPVAGWDAWRGTVHAPAVVTPTASASPVSSDGEVAEGTQGEDEHDGANESASDETPADGSQSPGAIEGFRFIPRLYFVVPTRTVEPELY